MPLEPVQPRHAVVSLLELWKEQGRTVDLGKILGKENLAGDDGVNGRLSEAVFRELPKLIGTDVVTWGTESALALLRSLPDHLVEIQRNAGLDVPYDVDQVQSYDNFYRDYTRAVVREAVLQMLFTTENPPHLVVLALERAFSEPGDVSRCWYEITHDFVAVAEQDAGIVYKFG